MEYIVKDNKLFRITNDGKEQKLGYITDNGRGDAIACTITPVFGFDKLIEECKEFGLPKYDEHHPIPFWDDGIDIKRAYDEYYKFQKKERKMFDEGRRSMINDMQKHFEESFIKEYRDIEE